MLLSITRATAMAAAAAAAAAPTDTKIWPSCRSCDVLFGQIICIISLNTAAAATKVTTRQTTNKTYYNITWISSILIRIGDCYCPFDIYMVDAIHVETTQWIDKRRQIVQIRLATTWLHWWKAVRDITDDDGSLAPSNDANILVNFGFLIG